MFKKPVLLKKMFESGSTELELSREFEITLLTVRKVIAMPMDAAFAIENRWNEYFEARKQPPKNTYEEREKAKLERWEARKQAKREKLEAKEALVLLQREEKRKARIELAEKCSALYVSGLTYQQIGDQFGFTREYVRQLCNKVGVDSSFKKVATAERKSIAAIDKQNRFAERIKSKWGCSVEEWRECREDGSITAFTEQRRNAGTRGIPWELSFKQWLDWWKATGKFHLRGRGEGKYCMSRNGDTGPYALWNIRCSTNEDNAREALTRAPTKPKSHSGVFKVHNGTSKPYLAKFSRTNIGYFETPEEAIAARTEYMSKLNLRSNGAGKGRGYTITKRGYIQMQFRGMNKTCSTIEEAKTLYRNLADEYNKTQGVVNA